MATRAQVPRADGESSIGVPTKKWGNIFAYKIDEATSLGNNASLGYRQPSTAQTVGDIRYHATLPAGWYLECTTAGTTGSGELTITSPTVGGTVSDGTVTWTIKSLNKSLLNIIGNDLSDCNDATKNGLYSYGNNTANKPGYRGALLTMRREDRCCQLALTLDDIEMNQYHMRTGTNLTSATPQYTEWQRIDTVVAESLGQTGYRKYASGLIVQWGVGHILANQKTSVVTLPISASLERSVLVTIRGPYSTNRIVYWNDVGTNTTTQIEIDTDSEATNQYGLYYNWYMIAKS